MGKGGTAKKLIVIDTVRSIVNKYVADNPDMTAAQAAEIWYGALAYHFGQSLSTDHAVHQAFADVMGK